MLSLVGSGVFAHYTIPLYALRTMYNATPSASVKAAVKVSVSADVVTLMDLGD